jgi:hypothetical protein
MKFREVAAGSVYGGISYLSGPADLERLERHIVHNLPLLGQFEGVVVATNYGSAEASELAAANRALWRRHVPGCVLLDSPLNRGHSIGTADLDNLLFDHCKTTGARRVCKSAVDVLLDAPLLDLDVEEAQFHYLNAVSYDALAEHGFDLEPFTGPGFFFPQTNFYVIDVQATDHLVDKDFLDRSWAYVQRIPDYDGRIWEHVPRWSCEQLLRKCVRRNRLTRRHLLSEAQWGEVLSLVLDRHITDCSLKNVAVNGICHLHEGETPWPVVSLGAIAG